MKSEMTSITEALNWSIDYLKTHNIESAVRNAEILLSHILDCDRPGLYLDKRTLHPNERRQITSVVEERVKGIPIQYITGKTEFMGLEFAVTLDTFIPRPETELLVETVIEIINSHRLWKITHQSLPSIVELGTGCGNIAVSLTNFTSNCKIVATDISGSALRVAGENAEGHGVEDRITFLEGDLFTPLEKVPDFNPVRKGDFSNGVNRWSLPIEDDGSLKPASAQTVGERNSLTGGTPSEDASLDNYYSVRDLNIIVSNPPYITSADMGSLPLEVQFEPSIALDGGNDGLYYYRRIIERSPHYLREGGYLVMEMGYGQRQKIEGLMIARGEFKVQEIVKDYSGIDRVMVARKTKK